MVFPFVLRLPSKRPIIRGDCRRSGASDNPEDDNGSYKSPIIGREADFRQQGAMTDAGEEGSKP